MDQDREPGRTFAPEQIGKIDFETRSPVDIDAGTYRYFDDGGQAIICSYQIGTAPVQVVAVKDFRAPLAWEDMPLDFLKFHAKVMNRTAVWMAWKAPFDRAAWNYGTAGFPFMEPWMIIDAMAQAMIAGLPPGLKMAAKFVGATPKVTSGVDHIKLFCVPGATATPQSHPRDWRDFVYNYAVGDIVTMGEVFNLTRQLPIAEWREFWAMEQLNDNGIAIDRPMVKHATWLANEDRRRANAELLELTGGKIKTVDQVKVMIQWLVEALPAGARELLVKREEETDDDGEITRPAKFSLTRQKVERLIAFVEAKCPELTVPLRVLNIRLYGGGKAPMKFARMWSQHVDGVLYGSYVFSGAPQTGRSSSKGPQLQNLTRKFLSYEHDAIEAILAHCDYEQLAVLGDDAPVSKKLSLLVRPALVPRSPSNLFVNGDWKNIEARITPWLCDHLEGARKRLDMFRAIDADPTLPDIYTLSAADVSGVPIEQVTKQIRQRGKVAELALQFLGGANALISMGASLGVHFDEDDAKDIVRRWRAANSWAVAYGDELWEAMLLAKSCPGEFVRAGRCGYIFVPEFLGGSMMCMLPSGRFLTYRALRYEDVAVRDDDDNIIGHQRELTYGRQHGRAKLWKGILVENNTQATGACLLRGTIVRLNDELPKSMPVVLQSHDELMLETHLEMAPEAAERLREIMERGWSWTRGLPLVADIETMPYYSKWEAE